MEKLNRYAKSVLIGAGMLLFLGLGIDSSGSAPPEAFVAADLSSNTYFGPNCVSVVPPGWMADGGSLGTIDQLESSGFTMTTIEQVREAGFGPDPDCREQGEFISEGRSLTGMLLESVGVLSPLPPRWNSDGTWNY